MLLRPVELNQMQSVYISGINRLTATLIRAFHNRIRS